MAYTDPTLEARRQQISGSKTIQPVSSSSYSDPVLETRRIQVANTPKPKIVSKPIQTAPLIAKPNIIDQAVSTIKGFFTPKGGTKQEINPPTPKIVQLTPQQQKAVGSLKVGDMIPNFQAPSAQLKPAKPGQSNLIDDLFKEPVKYLQKNISDAYQNLGVNQPLVDLENQVKATNPKAYQELQNNFMYKASKNLQTFENEALKGVVQGAVRMYANWNPEVEKFLNTELKDVGQKGDVAITGNTAGNIVGTIGSFILGGEVLTALKFGKVALPILFAGLGQTSLPANTPIDARVRNLVIDTVTGTLLEYIKPLANLKNLSSGKKAIEYTKQATKGLTVLSGQIYADARSLGASHDEALKMVKDSALIILGLHGVLITAKAGQYAVSSKFKQGTAEFTPQQVRDIVVNSNLEKSPLGKELLKQSINAEAQGKNLVIDMDAAKKSKVAGALNLDTPNGIRITKIELVDPNAKIEAPVTEKPVVTEEKAITTPKENLSKALTTTEGDIVNLKTVMPDKVNAFPQKPENAVVEKNVDVPVDQISFGREDISKKRLVRVSQATTPIIEDINAVYDPKTDKYTIVDDGNHRLANAILKGDETIKITNVYKSPAETVKPVEIKPVEETNGQNLTAFKVGEIVKDIYDNKLYKVGETNRAGVATITDTKTGEVSQMNAGNNARYVLNKVTPQPSTPDAVPSVNPTKEFVMRPSKGTEKAVQKEVVKLELPSSVLKFSNKGGGNQWAYRKPLIGKSDLKTIVKSNNEFSDNPVLTVVKNKEGNIRLAFDGKKIHFQINPDALGLSAERILKLKIGTKIKVDKASLSVGTEQQMRVYKGNDVYAFNPKNLEDPFSPKADGEYKKLVKQSDIAKQLSEKLNVPIRRGKFRHPGAIGIFKSQPKVVRIKSGGLQTIFHEVGHFLDDKFKLSNSINKTEREALMKEYGSGEMYKGQADKQRHEAFAEFLRFKMTGQDAKAKELAPEFYKEWDKRMKELPEIKEVLDTATADFKRWAEQPAVAKVLSQISIGKQDKGKFVDRAVNKLHDLYTAGLDDLHPLSEFVNIAEKKQIKINAPENPYILARNLRGWVGKADMFLNKGTFEKKYWSLNDKGEVKMNFTGKSYSEIMRPIEEKGLMDEFRVYLISKRIVEDLAPRKIKTGIALKDAQTALEELNAKYPEFEKIGQERLNYKDSLLIFGKENGLIGEEGLRKMKAVNKYHVPLYRVMEESNTKFLGKSKFAGNLASPIKRIKGSEREIIDPFESDVKDTYAIINAAERNNIGIMMGNLASQDSELGRLFEKVDNKLAPVTVNVQEVLKSALKGTDITPDMLPDELQEITTTIFRPTQDRGSNMLNVNRGDKQEVYQVDPDLFKAIQGLNAEDLGTIIKLLSLPAKTLRAGATLTPDFSVRNPLRDQFTAFVYSKHGFIPGIDLVRGMFELFKKGDVYDLWKAGGGEHSMFVSLDRADLQKSYQDLYKSNKQKALQMAKNPIEFLRILSEIGEMGTRLGEIRRAVKKGVDPIQGAFDARNVTLDFARIGTTGKGFNAITAFFNANIQGTDVMIRNFKTRPFNTLLKVLLGITLPSILLYLANRKDPRWKEIPQWQKNIFWIVMTKDHIFRIPKPFELGIIFGSVPERVMEVIDTKDPEAFDELEKSIIGGFTPGFIPTGLIPIIENWTNYSLFLNRPIVSRGKENLPPSQQSGTYTSEISKVLGETLNYSPAKMDNLIYGYTGGLGRYATSTIDKVLTGTGIKINPPEPATSIERLPVLKAFMIENPQGTGSESVNRLYNKYAETNAQLTYTKQLVDDGKIQEAKDYVKKHPDTVNAVVLGQAVDLFSDINSAITEIRKDEKMSPQDKKKKIDQLQILETNIAAKVLDNIKKK